MTLQSSWAVLILCLHGATFGFQLLGRWSRTVNLQVTRDGLKDAGIIDCRESLFPWADSEMPSLSSPRKARIWSSVTQATWWSCECESIYVHSSGLCSLSFPYFPSDALKQISLFFSSHAWSWCKITNVQIVKSKPPTRSLVSDMRFPSPQAPLFPCLGLCACWRRCCIEGPDIYKHICVMETMTCSANLSTAFVFSGRDAQWCSQPCLQLDEVLAGLLGEGLYATPRPRSWNPHQTLPTFSLLSSTPSQRPQLECLMTLTGRVCWAH